MNKPRKSWSIIIDTVLTSVPILLLFHGVLIDMTDYASTIVICLVFLLSKFGNKLYDLVSNKIMVDDNYRISKFTDGMRQINNGIVLCLIVNLPQYMVGVYIYRVLSFCLLSQFNIVYTHDTTATSSDDRSAKIALLSGIISFILFIIIDQSFQLNYNQLWIVFVFHQAFLISRDALTNNIDIRNSMKTKP